MHINILSGLNKKSKRGFTLAEILIVLGVLGFLSALTVPMVTMTKSTKPETYIAPHGTFECFWRKNADGTGWELVQHYADTEDDEHPNGVTTIIDGPEKVCSITVPKKANFYTVLVIGAGGDGGEKENATNNAEKFKPVYNLSALVNDIGEVNMNSVQWDEEGSIRLDNNFQADMEAAPDWVRGRWNTQWTGGFRSQYRAESNALPRITYTLTTPIGSGGNARCSRKTENNRQEANCASGGNSGNGGQVTVSDVKLLSSHDVTYKISTSETTLSLGTGGAVSLAASKSGTNAKINPVTNWDSIKGEHGREWYHNDHRDEDVKITTADTNTGGILDDDQVAVLKLEDVFHKAGCYELQALDGKNLSADEMRLYIQQYCKESQTTGEYKTAGTITVEPQSISYAASLPYVQANYSTAGKSAIPMTKTYSKLPSYDLVLSPALNAGGKGGLPTTKSSVFAVIEDERKEILASTSGENGNLPPVETHLRKINLHENENYFPFPESALPLVQPQEYIMPTYSASGFHSEFLDMIESGAQPGFGGSGAFPIIYNFAYRLFYKINGIIVVNQAHLGNDENRKTFADAAGYNGCADSETGEPKLHMYNNRTIFYCGSTTGQPGAIVVSW